MPEEEPILEEKLLPKHKTKKLRSLRWRNFGGKARALTVIALVATVGIVVTYVTYAQQQVTQEETVILSNGHEVRLGEPVAELTATVQLHATADRSLFVYPADTTAGKPQAFIYVDDGKVTAIHIVDSRENRLKDSEDRVGNRLSELHPRIRDRLQAVDQRLDTVKQPGYKTRLSRSTRYLIIEPCTNNDQIAGIALALNGRPSRIPRADLDCHAEVD